MIKPIDEVKKLRRLNARFTIVFIILIVFLSISLVENILKYKSAVAQLEETEQTLENTKETLERLEAEKRMDQEAEMIEEYARKKWGYVYPNEITYKFF